jgi:hypothetical protein
MGADEPAVLRFCRKKRGEAEPEDDLDAPYLDAASAGAGPKAGVGSRRGRMGRDRTGTL